MTRKDISKYTFYLSLFMFLILGCAIVALVVKIMVFPDSSIKEFILSISQAAWLSTALLYTSKYIKQNGTAFAYFYDDANKWLKFLMILVGIVLFSIVAEIVEMMLLIIL